MREPIGPLGRALINESKSEQDGTTQSASHSITTKIQASERTRIRAIAAITIFFWLLVAGGILVLAYAHFLLYLPRELALVTDPDLPQKPGYVGSEEGLRWLSRVGFWVATGTVVALTGAALSTVWLVSVTRRVTLRQVDANLVAICKELKQLQITLASK